MYTDRPVWTQASPVLLGPDSSAASYTPVVYHPRPALYAPTSTPIYQQPRFPQFSMTSPMPFYAAMPPTRTPYPTHAAPLMLPIPPRIAPSHSDRLVMHAKGHPPVPIYAPPSGGSGVQMPLHLHGVYSGKALHMMKSAPSAGRTATIEDTKLYVEKKSSDDSGLVIVDDEVLMELDDKGKQSACSTKLKTPPQTSIKKQVQEVPSAVPAGARAFYEAHANGPDSCEICSRWYRERLEFRLSHLRPAYAPDLRARRVVRLLKLREKHGKSPKERKKKVERPRPERRRDAASSHLPPKKGYVCHQCGIPGHWMEDCSAPRVIVRPPPHYICHSCHYTGHWMEDCDKREARRDDYHPFPPPSYVCKLCRKRGHWAQKCSARAHAHSSGSG
jgi:hypothetical protein